MPAAQTKRSDDMLSQQLVLEGELLGRFDQIRKLSLTACDKRWALTEGQTLRLHEFVALLRKGVRAPR
jgi:hypothetical protein